MQEQRRKMSVGKCCQRGLGTRVILILQRVVPNIYHGCRGPRLWDGKAQKDHTLPRECWGSIEMIWVSHDVGVRLWASCWPRRTESPSLNHYSHHWIPTLDPNRALGLEVSLTKGIVSHSGQVMGIHRVVAAPKCNVQAKWVIERIVGSGP